MEFQSAHPLNITPVATAAAWHVLGHLLGRGRPVRPSEMLLAPDFIRFLCSIPNSPLRLADDGFVTLSEVGVAALAHFFANSDLIARYFDSPQPAPRLLTNVSSNGSLRTYCRKRKRAAVDLDDFPTMKRKSFFQDLEGEENSNRMPVAIPSKSQIVSTQVIQALSSLPSLSAFYFWKLEKNVFLPVQDMQLLGCLHRMNSPSYICNQVMTPHMNRITAGALSNSVLCWVSHPVNNSNSEEGSGIGGAGIVNPSGLMNISASSKLETDDEMIVTQGENGAITEDCNSLFEGVNWKMEKALKQNSDSCENHRETQPTDGISKKPVNSQPIFNDKGIDHLESQPDMLSHPNISSSLNHGNMDEAYDRKKAILPTMENHRPISDKGREQLKRDRTPVSVKQKKQFDCDQIVSAKEKRDTSIENRENASSISNSTDQAPFPEFESFIVEAQEGSGGYGTVYRARRKEDGQVFAIKCPHVNANRNNVTNEMKMLERLGGKDFVIKYEGSFKSRNADCLVLQHVQYDKPENLRKEMGVSDLLWYGYCLFKALAGLHKQGVVHRDVKPGNFLYTCKMNKGYLIDFNLAFDTRKKYGTVDNGKLQQNLNDPTIICRTKSLQPAKSRKLFDSASVDVVNKNAGKVSRSLLPPGNLKKKVEKAKVFTEASSRNIIKSQGADGSGITSVKEATSTRTPSGERLRKLLPNHSRRELLSLAQEALQGGNTESVGAPKSKRKRVAALAGDAGSKLLYITPMPLHASGLAIRGAGALKNKGDCKNTREGLCAGTKGFKAPEVLFKSLHQGPKVDIWSAGVTLLYMIIGRTPFPGDNEQNLKEIVKLRGSEELWEVAKLHNNDSLFPTDLLDAKYLSPVNLRDWCARNTRRPELLHVIPRSLLDLIDKCLVVNPRQRISAEEALSHEFFALCRETFRKHRLQKQGPSIDSKPKLLLHGEAEDEQINLSSSYNAKSVINPLL